MRSKKIAIATCLLVLTSSVALADSPLTSTKFADAYMDEPIVTAASNTNGILTNELMDYLTSKNNPVDVKMAIINKLGWNIEGKNNSKVFMQYLTEKYKYSSETKFLKKGKSDDLLSMAYLKALDDYFKVADALKYAERALKKKRTSRTYHLIAGLIKAQQVMDEDWCEVYQIADRIRKNDNLKNDMRTGAVTIIYGYMDIYGKSCK